MVRLAQLWKRLCFKPMLEVVVHMVKCVFFSHGTLDMFIEFRECNLEILLVKINCNYKHPIWVGILLFVKGS